MGQAAQHVERGERMCSVGSTMWEDKSRGALFIGCLPTHPPTYPPLKAPFSPQPHALPYTPCGFMPIVPPSEPKL